VCTDMSVKTIWSTARAGRSLCLLAGADRNARAFGSPAPAYCSSSEFKAAR
jgi:hypothetical protein